MEPLHRRIERPFAALLKRRLPQNITLPKHFRLPKLVLVRGDGEVAPAVPALASGFLPASDSSMLPLLLVSLALNVWLWLGLRRRKPKAAQLNGHASIAGERSQLTQVAARRRERAARRSRETPVIGSLMGAVEQLEAMQREYKYTAAGELLDELNKALDAATPFSWGAPEAKARLSRLLADGKLVERIRVAREAADSLNGDSGFELVKEAHGKRVMQRFTSDRHLTVKIESILDGVQPADCLQIWREAELYPKWFPFVSGGKILANLHPGEVILHILVDTFFMSVDMCLWGWACDNLDSAGTFMLNVRPVRSHTLLPSGVKLPRVDQTGASKLFGALRAHAVIDVLLEPLGDNSVRFAFQMSDSVPPFMPSWAINYIVQNAMADIFDKMRDVALKMHSKDASSPHVQHVRRPAYREVRDWYASKMASAIARLRREP